MDDLGYAHAAGTVSPDNNALVRDAIIDHGLIAILRAPSAERFRDVTDVLVESGLRIIEVTLTAEGALAALSDLVEQYASDDRVVVGAGTVLTADQAEACIDVGASFIVSPVGSPDVIASARMAHIAVMPGAMTTSEIFAAYGSGADAVKLFPASALSPRFIKDVHGPLPDIPLIPTGGVDIDDVPEWISAGAAAVGLGGSLIGESCVGQFDKAALASRAVRAVDAVARARP